MVLTSNGHEAPSVERDVHVEHRTHTVYDGRVNDGDWGVQITTDFATGSFEVEYSRAGLLIDINFQLDLWDCSSQIATRHVLRDGFTGEPSSR